ncbi:sulfotransferase domain-containing protein [Neiella marina]|uniref:Sulfotransferase domain-containing protein n=1 Tax=Neiella holothuriorum TaxID=2870530 RepID=A0ABS7EFH5_9GAMM|nr:sulfotransferase domain-containing protein [Neiella holothuriorum]MBW8191104.1 sulfotransferase domain-containing protein [Neiella holothuriorum]
MPLLTRIKHAWRMMSGNVTEQKVAFVVAGAQKSGTTALDKYLRCHNDLLMPDKKEVHFFDHSKLFEKGEPNYRQYQAYYEPQTNDRLMGDVTPAYMYLPDCMTRIQAYNPQMKVIAVLRNPIERAYSHWNMERHRGREKLPFVQAMAEEAERLKQSRGSSRKFSYVNRGFYSQQIERIWQHFPKQQTLFVRHDELLADPTGTVNQIYRFLGVTELPHTEKKDVHSRPYVSSMSASEHAQLINIFRAEITALEGLLDWQLDDWLTHTPKAKG